MHTLARVITSSALAVIMLSSAEWAHADRFELSLGSAARIMPSDSVDALTEDQLTLFSMTGALAIDRIQVPFFNRFSIEGTFEAGGMSGTTFQALETNTSVFLWALGARLSRDLSERLSIHGRANLGIARVGLTISDQIMDSPILGDTSYTGTAYLGAASDFLLATRRRAGGHRFALGLRAEVGYLAALPTDLHARPDDSGRDEGTIVIPETAASLGTLNLSAWSLRVGVVGRF
jgi:hypothetical protein